MSRERDRPPSPPPCWRCSATPTAARARAVIAAPAQAVDAKPKSRSITVPPSHGPLVLPRLNAAVVVAPASVGAAPATLNIRAFSAGAVKKADRPSRNASATTAVWLEANRASATRNTVDAVMPLSSTPKRCASATRPPITVPISAPTPNRPRIHGTQPESSPATSVSSGAR
ncbi:hypothetical protein EES46_05270 [Streptomyces sp. ADI98-10]|nr:hypothetical protein EES46_05270 [Streptomyces sp. ADI98-10]